MLDWAPHFSSRRATEYTMPEKIVPMIHVPDVRATAAWYTSIGFKLVRQNEEDGEINWALLTLGQ